MSTPLDPSQIPPELQQAMAAQGDSEQNDQMPEEMPDDHVDLTDLIEAIHAGAMLCKGAETGDDFQRAATGVKLLVDAVNELVAPKQPQTPGRPPSDGNPPGPIEPAGGADASGSGQ